MKKLQSLGRILSKEEQKRIMGGDEEVQEIGCSQELDFCGVNAGITYKCCPDDNSTCVNEKCVK
jgi:hypothetical protein